MMMRDEYQARRDLIWSGMAALGFDFPKPEGAFYAFVPMKPALTEKIIASGVIVTPGSAFGVNAPEYTRFSYATSRKNITLALERIGRLVK
jgi:aspartate aminotransferase